MTSSSAIVQRLWNYCTVLRDDGMSYGDYVEQLTYLLFLKMDNENVTLLGKESAIAPEFGWDTLLARSGDDLETHYRHILTELGKGAGLIPTIFRKAQNKIQDPAKLESLVRLIDTETWVGLDIDIKGEIYEGLLEKNAQDTKSGAGQYFTPRALIQAIVDVMQPAPDQTICDPACGTGGFLLATLGHIVLGEDRDFHTIQTVETAFNQYQLRKGTIEGMHILVAAARYLAAHAPTVRAQGQTYQITERLHKGEKLFEG